MLVADLDFLKDLVKGENREQEFRFQRTRSKKFFTKVKISATLATRGENIAIDEIAISNVTVTAPATTNSFCANFFTQTKGPKGLSTSSSERTVTVVLKAIKNPN